MGALEPDTKRAAPNTPKGTHRVDSIGLLVGLLVSRTVAAYARWRVGAGAKDDKTRSDGKGPPYSQLHQWQLIA